MNLGNNTCNKNTHIALKTSYNRQSIMQPCPNGPLPPHRTPDRSRSGAGQLSLVIAVRCRATGITLPPRPTGNEAGSSTVPATLRRGSLAFDSPHATEAGNPSPDPLRLRRVEPAPGRFDLSIPTCPSHCEPASVQQSPTAKPRRAAPDCHAARAARHDDDLQRSVLSAVGMTRTADQPARVRRRHRSAPPLRPERHVRKPPASPLIRSRPLPRLTPGDGRVRARPDISATAPPSPRQPTGCTASAATWWLTSTTRSTPPSPIPMATRC